MIVAYPLFANTPAFIRTSCYQLHYMVGVCCFYSIDNNYPLFSDTPGISTKIM